MGIVEIVEHQLPRTPERLEAPTLRAVAETGLTVKANTYCDGSMSKTAAKPLPEAYSLTDLLNALNETAAH
jgi:hypothetical protein